MSKDHKILLLYQPENESCKRFVLALQRSLREWDVALAEVTLTNLMFQTRKADLTHFFLPPSAKSFPLVRTIAGKTKMLQTLLAAPEKPEDYRNVLLARQVVVFSHQEKSILGRYATEIQVEVIPPCVDLPDPSSLQASSKVREIYAVEDRMLVISLSDVSNRKSFDAFLYVTREYNRRGGFRFLIPHYRSDKETTLWRDRLQEAIRLEKLNCASLLDEPVDIHSLLDSADFAVHMERKPDPEFSCSLHALEALCMGKPVICFNIAPLNEVIREIKARWVANNIEDVVRESRDLKKQQAELEQISTELSRAAKGRLSAEIAASSYGDLYNRLLAV